MNLRYALRTLVRAPGFTAVAVLTLALGIGLNTVVFTLYEAVALKPIAARAPGELIRISGSQDTARLDSFSDAQFRQIRAQMGLAAAVLATSGPHILTARMPQAVVLHARFVSVDYFEILGVAAQIGRTFELGDRSAAVISYGFWQKLNRDPSALSGQIRVQGATLDIVGVAPREFAGTGTPPQMPDIWIPLAAQPEVLPGPDWQRDETVREFQLLARRKAGVTVAQASAQLDALANTWPPVNGKRAHLAARPATFFQTDSGEFEVFGTISAILMAAVTLILIMGSVNLVNLLFARHASRDREFAVRLALGARRLQLVRQLCTESAVVGILGGAAGLLFSLWACDWIRTAINSALERMTGGAFGLYLNVAPDWRIFCYTLAVSLATGVAIGIWPAVHASRRDIAAALKLGSGGSEAGQRSVWSKRSLLLSAQVAACMTLLAGAGLLFRGAWSSSSVDPGFETKHLMIVGIDPKTVAPSPAARNALLRQIAGRLQEMPEVAAIGWADRPPFLGHGTGGFQNEHGSSIATLFDLVSDGYFDALGVRFLAGRNFTREEVDTGAPVAVIDEAAARRAWPGQNPVGRRISDLGWLRGGTEFTHDSATVVGVVRNLHSTYLSKADEAYLYLPRPLSSSFGTLLVRTRIAPEAAFQSILTTLEKVNANLPSQTYLMTMERGPMEIQRMMAEAPAAAASVLGGLALLLAAVGVFGLVAQLVAKRTREIAIRVSLGAQRADVIRLVMLQTMRPVFLGTAVGLAGALGISALLASMLVAPDLPDLTYGAGAFSAASFAAALAILAATIALASFLPVRRATRVQPAEALRM
jgi:predicted permease